MGRKVFARRGQGPMLDSGGGGADRSVLGEETDGLIWGSGSRPLWRKLSLESVWASRGTALKDREITVSFPYGV